MNLSGSLVENVRNAKNEFGIILSVLVSDALILFKIEIFPFIESLIFVIPVRYRFSIEKLKSCFFQPFQ